MPWGSLASDGRRPWWLGGAGLTRVALHRDLYYLATIAKERGEAQRLTGHSNRPETQRRRRKERAALMALANSRKGRSRKGRERGGERGRGGGDGVFLPSVELVVERARRERRRPDLSIGRLGWCPCGEIFLAAVLIHRSTTWLTLSGHIAMAGTCSCAHRSFLGGYSGGSARRRLWRRPLTRAQ